MVPCLIIIEEIEAQAKRIKLQSARPSGVGGSMVWVVTVEAESDL